MISCWPRKGRPEFKIISFADMGDLAKDKAIELFKASGYTIDKTGASKTASWWWTT